MFDLSNENFIRDNERWSTARLIRYCEEQKYTPFDLPLDAINTDVTPWGQNNEIWWFINHSKRVNEANLDYPVLIDDRGNIANGWHRIVKAFIEGKGSIKAIKIKVMPEADGVINED